MIHATQEAGERFVSNRRLKEQAPLLDITTVNPCVSSNLDNAARHAGKQLAHAVQRKNNRYRGSFPAAYSLFLLAMSTCGKAGPDVRALIKELVIRHIEHRSEMHSERGPRIWRKEWKERVSGGRFPLFYSTHCHSVRETISSERWGDACRQPVALVARCGASASMLYREEIKTQGAVRMERGGIGGGRGPRNRPNHHRSEREDVGERLTPTCNQQLQPQDPTTERSRRVIRGIRSQGREWRGGNGKFGREVEGRARTRQTIIEVRWNTGKS